MIVFAGKSLLYLLIIILFFLLFVTLKKSHSLMYEMSVLPVYLSLKV